MTTLCVAFENRNRWFLFTHYYYGKRKLRTMRTYMFIKVYQPVLVITKDLLESYLFVYIIYGYNLMCFSV